MPGKKLEAFLDKNKVKYTSIQHPLAYSAKETSHVCHISEKVLAKTIICNVGDKMVMMVLPAADAVDLQGLKKSLHEPRIGLANEAEFSPKFSDCELGAMPPFGNLYDMDVYVDKKLSQNKEIAFNAGTHRELIKMSYQDFAKLVQAKEINITQH
jgi:Ala-tRNA(Pro) deacylase